MNKDERTWIEKGFTEIKDHNSDVSKKLDNLNTAITKQQGATKVVLEKIKAVDETAREAKKMAVSADVVLEKIKTVGEAASDAKDIAVKADGNASRAHARISKLLLWMLGAAITVGVAGVTILITKS